MQGSEVARIVADLLTVEEVRRETALRNACGGCREIEAAVRAGLQRVQRMARSLGVPADALLEQPEEGTHSGRAEGNLHPWLSPGERIGAYEAGQFHAAGGSSQVYVAHRTDGTGGAVALKVMAWRQSSSMHARFLREAAIARQVVHPNLARILESGEDDRRGLLYHAMVFVPGNSLGRLLEHFAAAGQRPDPHQRRLLVQRFRDAAAALSALHARGIVHRDVKPQNLVLEGADDGDLERPLVLVDLGLAREQQMSGLPHSTVQVSWPYAAPEILLGWQATPRSDVFSLGVTMHDLFAGRRPHERGRSHTAGLEPMRELLPQIDPDLAAIVDEACQSDAKLRYHDAGALVADLDAWSSGCAIAVRPRAWIARLRREVRRHPGRVVLRTSRVAILLLLLVAATIGVVHVARGIADGNAAERAWQLGDFATCAATLQRVPAWTRAWFATPALGSQEGSAEAAVLDEVRKASVGSASQLAAAWLDRDGLAAYPRLVRFLALSVRRDSGEVLAERLRALQAVASLLYQRPCVDRADELAGSPLRQKLLQVIGDQTDVSLSAAWAAGALGGCGQAEDIGALVTYAEQCAAAGSPIDIEGIRLVAVSLDQIARRSHATADAPAHVAAMIDALRRVWRCISSVEGATLDVATLWIALDDWHLAAACLARAADTEWPADAIPERVPPPLVRAAMRDQGFSGALRSAGDWLPDLSRGHEPLPSAAEYQHCYGSGRLTGLFDDPDLTTSVRARLPDLASRHGLDESWCQDLFQRGHDHGRAELRGGRPDRAVESSARLGRAATRQPQPHEPVPFAHVKATAANSVAEASFQDRPAQASGALTSIESMATEWRQDSLHPHEHCLNLGSAGRSEVRIGFRVPRRPQQGIILTLYLQRTWRDALPFGGSSGFEVLLDDAVAAAIPEIFSMSAELITLPVGRSDGGDHTLRIRLTGDATASLWLYSLQIR